MSTNPLLELDLELDFAELRDAHPLKPGGTLFEDLKPMTIRQMKEKFPVLHYSCAKFCEPFVHQWMSDPMGDGRVFYGSISDDKIYSAFF